MDNLTAWQGRTEEQFDAITAAPLAAMAALLDRDDPAPHPGRAVPPLWHWLYFLPVHRQSQLGPDGHALRGGFLPPVDLPRRMWAGGRLRFLAPLQVGDQARRVSTIADITSKEGRSGKLVFVLVRHVIEGVAGVAIEEEHDIVYRANPQPGDPEPSPVAADLDHDWIRDITPDPVLLFRYSALTFNGHRIHYDQPYVTQVEGYPGLIVHGPLIASLLLDLVRRERPAAVVTAFSFRAVQPLFDIHRFSVCGRVEPDGHTITLWAKTLDGQLAMRAEALLA
jgi:3-methylfumaryl-CoA hydratase